MMSHLMSPLTSALPCHSIKGVVEERERELLRLCLTDDGTKIKLVAAAIDILI